MVHLFSILIVVLFYLLVYSPYLNINMNNMLYYLLFYYDIYIFLIINTYLDLFFMKSLQRDLLSFILVYYHLYRYISNFIIILDHIMKHNYKSEICY